MQKLWLGKQRTRRGGGGGQVRRCEWVQMEDENLILSRLNLINKTYQLLKRNKLGKFGVG